MRIVLIGAGRMGFALAQEFDKEGHEVYLVDTNPARVERARTHLDVMAAVGSGSSLKLLRELGVADADLMIATSTSDEINLIACLLGRELGIHRRIARVNNADLVQDLNAIGKEVHGVDEIINPMQITIDRLYDMVASPGTTEAAEFANGAIVLRALRVETSSELTEVPLWSLAAIFGDHFLVTAVRRDQDLLIPGGNFQIAVGDVIYVVMEASLLPRFLQVFRFQRALAKCAAVFGIRPLSIALCERLEKEIPDVLLLDRSEELCRMAAQRLQRTSVICGSALDRDFMEDLKIGNADYYLGLTESEGANFTSALLAKRLGVETTLILTDNPDHVALFDTLPVDAVVSPLMLSVGSILCSVRAGRVLSLFKIAADRAEAIEVEASEGAPAVGRPLREIKFPPGIVVAAVVGKEGPLVAGGGTVIHPGERVVLVALRERACEAASLFSIEKGCS